jgi:hypothetical protein
MARDRISTKRVRSKKELKEFKNAFYYNILGQIKQGLNPQQISKKLQRSIQNINYYISNLKRWGYVRKVGYGTWELTKLGDYTTTKKFTWGTHKPKKIELWRLGYRFYIRYDTEIPELKEQILAQGGRVYQGRVMGCWVMKGNETLDIYGTVAKADNLWDAGMKAMNEVVSCKGYIEEKYKMLLEPMNPLRPDIIVNTPETKKVANTIHEELGKIRTEFFDVDESKTGQPELEARTLPAAANLLDNLAVTNKADRIQEKVDQMEQLIKGSLSIQMAISNSFNLQSATLKELSKAVERISGVLEKLPFGTHEVEEITPAEPTQKEGIYKYVNHDKYNRDDNDMTYIEIMDDTGEFVGLRQGIPHTYDLKKGARIYMEWLSAKTLIGHNKARLIR